MTAGSGDERFPSSLSDLIERAGKQAPDRAVEGWNPDHSGTIDMRIDPAGNWFYNGSPIAREALVRLFASILRRDPDGRFVLVTPVEKLAMTVEDAPFAAVEMAAEGSGANQVLNFRTNVGDIVTLDAEHRLWFDVENEHGGLKPYISVRGGLEALVTRALTFDLIELAMAHDGADGLWSSGVFFPLPNGEGA